MKSLNYITITTFLMVVCIKSLVAGPCSEEWVELEINRQSQIDSFQINYPDCDSFNGDIYIDDRNDDISSLEGLSQLKSINGSLEITNCDSLKSLDGIDSLKEIGASFYVSKSPSITDFGGIRNLEFIGENFIIYLSNNIVSINIANKLKVIKGFLSLGGSILENISGFDSLSKLGKFRSYTNRKLREINGFKNLKILNEIEISYNDKLTDISGFKSIKVDSLESFTIIYCPLLSDCSLPNLCEKVRSIDAIDLENNRTGCNSVEEITKYCDSTLDCEANYTFRKQSQIDNFKINYPDCKNIDGEVIIEGNKINNIFGLSNIESIGASLKIIDSQVQTLEGFNNLQSIGKSLVLRGNTKLENISGLKNASGQFQDLIIDSNLVLKTLNGLKNVSSTNNLLIKNCTLLQEIDDLSGLTYISNIEILNNKSLKSISGLKNIEFGNKELIIKSNDSLLSLRGLENIEKVGFRLFIENNDELTNLEGLDNLQVAGKYYINQYSAVPGEVSISDNNSLIDLKGLENFKKVKGNFSISNNNSIVSLSGLNNFSYVSNSYDYHSHSYVGGNFRISNNPKLSHCSIQSSICKNFDLGEVYFSNNADSCNSTKEVLSYCAISSSAPEKGMSENWLYPNPTNGVVYLNKNFQYGTIIRLYNNIGRLLKTFDVSSSTTIDISNQPSGIYYIQILNSSKNIMRTIIKK